MNYQKLKQREGGYKYEELELKWELRRIWDYTEVVVISIVIATL